MFVHEKFIALFVDPLQTRKTAKIKGRLMFWRYFLPTRFAEDPKFIRGYFLGLLTIKKQQFLEIQIGQISA
jgi:hypothetical protein